MDNETIRLGRSLAKNVIVRQKYILCYDNRYNNNNAASGKIIGQVGQVKLWMKSFGCPKMCLK